MPTNPRRAVLLAVLAACAAVVAPGKAARGVAPPDRSVRGPAPAIEQAAPESTARPSLLIPARHDSVSIESAPAPLLGPGLPALRDTLLESREQRALEQFALADQLERHGQLDAALLAFRNAAKFDKKLPEARYRIGHILARLGDLTEAARFFAAELAINPTHRAAGRELGLAFSRLGKHREAIARLARLTRSDPGSDENWYALGVAYCAAGRYRDAEPALRRAIRLPPARAVEHRDLGRNRV